MTPQALHAALLDLAEFGEVLNDENASVLQMRRGKT